VACASVVWVRSVTPTDEEIGIKVRKVGGSHLRAGQTEHLSSQQAGATAYSYY